MAESDSRREPIEELAESFLARFRAGQRPSLTEFTAAHPELADQIRELFPALVEMEQAGSMVESVTGPALPRAGDAMTESLGDYRIIREVGRGGMAVVYEAIQESLGRHVALKVFSPWLRADARQIERFRREARAAARLHHTNIVPVFGVGEEKGLRYYAMQFIQGQGLDAILHELRRLRSAPEVGAAARTSPDSALPVRLAATVARSLLSGRFAAPTKQPQTASTAGDRSETGHEVNIAVPAAPARDEPSSGASHWASQAGGSYARTVARVGLQVAEALVHAHGQGILHRDIKPSNLLLDTEGSIWVADFGLAKSDDADALTESGDIVGTVRYMAPERFRGDSGPESDVYGLGVTLYELSTLCPAFDSGDRARLIDHILHTDPPPPRAIEPKIPRDFETIVLKAMSKHPADRYVSARALAEDLSRFLDDRTIMARRSSVTERLSRWCKRNPGLAALNALAATLTTAIAIISTLAAIWLGQSRNKALDNLWRAMTAEAQARTEAENARRSAAESEAVRKFLENDLLAAARPEGQGGGLGKNATIRQAVDAARPRIATAFKNEPLIEAAVRHTLGATYLCLGEPVESIPELERARALREDKLGPDHPDTIDSRICLALAYRDARRGAEAIALDEVTLRRQESKLGPDHPDTLRSRTQLAMAYQAAGRIAESIALHEATLRLQETKLGRDHPDTLCTIFNLAACYHARGRHADALKLYVETLALRKARLGPDDPETLRSMHALGLSYDDLGRHSEALRIYEKTLALRKARLGPDHPDTLWTMANLAWCYAALGRHADALKLRLETLALRKARLGPDDPETLRSMNDLAFNYSDLGRHIEACKLFEEALRLRRAKQGPDHPETLQTQMNLTNSLLQLGRNAEAMSLSRQSAELLEKRQGTDGVSLYDAACSRALTSAAIRAADKSPEGARQADAEADRAMTRLKQAVAAGWNKAAHMARDHDLDTLRDRQDFKELMRSLKTTPGQKH
jgi:serine/threonine protein kinase/tetratricopeptide (TPR) repeat protein